MAAQTQAQGQAYTSAAGVRITAQLIEDETSEYYGLYRVTGVADGTVGHITPAQLADNFTPVAG